VGDSEDTTISVMYPVYFVIQRPHSPQFFFSCWHIRSGSDAYALDSYIIRNQILDAVKLTGKMSLKP